MTRSTLGAVAITLVIAGCGSEAGGGASDQTPAPAATVRTDAPTTSNGEPSTTGEMDDGCADVIDGSVTPSGDTFTVSATVRSADTGEDKYADRWEVRGPDGTVLGERVLTHPHVDEQPFTRSLSGVSIPDEVSSVVLAAHDSVVGFCGDIFEVVVQR